MVHAISYLQGISYPLPSLKYSAISSDILSQRQKCRSVLTCPSLGNLFQNGKTDLSGEEMRTEHFLSCVEGTAVTPRLQISWVGSWEMLPGHTSLLCTPDSTNLSRDSKSAPVKTWSFRVNSVYQHYLHHCQEWKEPTVHQ